MARPARPSADGRQAMRFRPGDRRRNGGGADVRHSILSATERLLKERRLDDITVVDLIEEAKVSRASFYLYFESKHAAVAALAEDVAQAMYEEVWSPWLGGTETPDEEILVQHMRDSLAAWREHQNVLVAAAEAWRIHPEVYRGWGRAMRMYVTELAAYIEAEREAGRAPDGLDAHALAANLVWGNECTIYLALAGELPEIQDDELLAATMAGLWHRAIYGKLG